MSSWDGPDRREFPRVNYPCLVVVRQPQNKENAFLTHTENIGIGGVGILVKDPLPLHSAVDLEIDLMDLGEHLQCRGKVVWAIQRKDNEDKRALFYDIGIEFVELDTDAAKRLKMIVDHICKDEEGQE